MSQLCAGFWSTGSWLRIRPGYLGHERRSFGEQYGELWSLVLTLLLSHYC